MPDDIIDAGVAKRLHAYAARTSSRVGWVVMEGLPAYSGRLIARLVTEKPTDYVLIGGTLGEIHEQLPPGLVRTERDHSDPPEVVEAWFAVEDWLR